MKKIIQKTACGIFPIYIKQNGDKEFLLIKSNHGNIAQPKGHMEKGETYLETAERELFEETGLKCLKIFSDNKITEKYFFGTKPITEKIVHSFIGIVNSKKVTLQEEEVSDSFWVSSQEALCLITFPEQKKSFKEMLAVLETLSI